MKILILLLLLTAPAFSQKTDCSFSKENVAIRGLQLGMSKKDFESKFTPLPYQDIETSWRSGEIRYIDKTRDPAFDGLWSVKPSFYGNKLYALEIQYRTSGFKDVREFSAPIAELWKIPSDLWIRQTRINSSITCNDFAAVADITLFPKLTLIDLRVVKQIAKDQADERDKRVKGFKP